MWTHKHNLYVDESLLGCRQELEGNLTLLTFTTSTLKKKITHTSPMLTKLSPENYIGSLQGKRTSKRWWQGGEIMIILPGLQSREDNKQGGASVDWNGIVSSLRSGTSSSYFSGVLTRLKQVTHPFPRGKIHQLGNLGWNVLENTGWRAV